MTGGEVAIEDGNEEIWQLLMFLDKQWLCGFSGIYGIDMQTVIKTAHALEIETDLLFFRKVHAYETEVLKHTGTNSGGCSEQKKSKCREMFGDNLDWACQNCDDKEK